MKDATRRVIENARKDSFFSSAFRTLDNRGKKKEGETQPYKTVIFYERVEPDHPYDEYGKADPLVRLVFEDRSEITISIECLNPHNFEFHSTDLVKGIKVKVQDGDVSIGGPPEEYKKMMDVISPQ